MTRTKTTKQALIMSVIALLLCFTMLLGTTFAWFTDSVTSAGNKIMSGTLNVDLELLDKTSGEWNSIKENKTALFNYDKWEPGYVEVKMLKVENEGTLALKWKAKFVAANELGILADVIDVYVRPYDVLTEDQAKDVAYPMTRDLEAEGYTKVGTVRDFINTIETTTTGKLEAGESAYLGIALKMQESANNDYQGKDLGAFDILILATQLDSEEDSFGKDYDIDAEYPAINIVDEWDGTADTSWYNDTDTKFTLTSAEQFAGFAMLVGQGKITDETIVLANDIDLSIDANAVNTVDPLSNYQYIGDSFAPIGSTGKFDDRGRLVCETFEGTFDGEGHTISNIYQSGWDFGYEWGQYGSIGLFSSLNNATVKNVVIDGFEAQVEGGDISFIAGSATGTCVFENITIKNSKIGTYNNGCGGIIGWSGEGNYTFKNITLEEDVVLGGLWGSFDSSIGGIVGQGEPGATYNFENVDIACRLDVYNDCTASYDYYNYRMCGMIIGRLEETTTIDGANYPDTSKYNITCTNVKVTYGEWANYHYCEPTPGLNGGRGMRVEPGFAYGGLPADFDHSQCVDNHMNLIAFDQILGGAQLGVKGLKTYEGVTVNYNNK